MDIRSYMKKHSLSQDGFAKQIGVTQGMVWQWLHGKTAVSAKKAKEIEEKTQGEIGKHELCDLFDPPEPRRRAKAVA